MRRESLIAFALMGLAAVPASADVSVGGDAPRIEAGSWYNLPRGVGSLKPKHLDGQIVMVEFWATW